MMPFVYDDLAVICADKRNLISWLQEKEILGDFGGLCDKCFKGKVNLRSDKSYSKDNLVWRCSNSKCHKKTSIREGSWFSGTHLLLEQAIKLTYYWVHKTPSDYVVRELKIGSAHTIADWYNFAREVCVEIIKCENEQIGGVGKEIEIDESKFGKRKYHRGKRVEGVWVFGGIERESKKCFFEIVEDRSAATLIPIIKRYVKPGSIILSDCWKAYSSLKEEGYIHLTVNHSVTFKNKETGACTNLIESTWNAVKKSFPKYGAQKQFYDSYLVEYIIRKKYLNDAEDKFLEFLNLIKKVYPGKKKRQPLSEIPVKVEEEEVAANSSLQDIFDDEPVNNSLLDLFDD